MNSDVTVGEAAAGSSPSADGRLDPLQRPDRRRLRAVADRRRRRAARAADRGAPLRLGLGRRAGGRGRDASPTCARRRPSRPTCGCSTATAGRRRPGRGAAAPADRRSTPTSSPSSSSGEPQERHVDGRRPATSRAGSCRRRRRRRRPRPLVVEIHGGPHTLYGWSPSSGSSRSSPRPGSASSTATRAARRATARRSTTPTTATGDPGPMRDVLAGVDALVADGLADPDRLGVTGGSYGGYLTNWIVGHDQRFRAAMTCRSRQRHDDAVPDRRHQRRRLGAARVRRDAVGRPGVLPRDLADHLRRRGSGRRS